VNIEVDGRIGSLDIRRLLLDGLPVDLGQFLGLQLGQGH